MDKFKKNLSLLRSHDPALARRVASTRPSDKIKTVTSRDGHPVPQVGSVSLHSVYRPIEEAVRLVSAHAFHEDLPDIVYGLGFGYHVRETLNRVSGSITVIEPCMEMFREFLAVVDLQPFLPRARFCIDEEPAKILARTGNSEKWNILEHVASVRISQEYFERLEKGRRLADFLHSKRLKILVVNPIYGGSLPTARFCSQALENLGHQVRSVQCEKFADGFFSIKDITKVKQHAGVLSNLFMNLMGELTAARAAEFQPDLILALAQAPLTPAALERLKVLNIPIAFWFVEDFRTLTYWKEIAASYDFIFAIQKGEFFEKLKSAGARNCYYLPQGGFPEIHKPLQLTPEEQKIYGAELSFMGAGYYNRKKTFPQLLKFDFKIWGTEWDLDSKIGERVQNNNCRVSTEESVKIYNGGQINLNLHSSTYHENINPEGDFVNPRTFEIAACSAFQLVDERSELDDVFRVGEEIVTFNSVPDLKEKIGYYFKHADERKRIARKGYERVLAEHTLEHRMMEMLIHIFLDQFETVKQRIEVRKEAVDYFMEQAGAETELGRYLEQFRGTPNFSLKTVTDRIAGGKGALTQTETLLLMLNQLVKEEV